MKKTKPKSVLDAPKPAVSAWQHPLSQPPSLSTSGAIGGRSVSTPYGSMAQMQQPQAQCKSSDTVYGGGVKPKVPASDSTPSSLTPSHGKVPTLSKASKLIEHAIRSLDATHRQNVNMLQGFLAPLQQYVDQGDMVACLASIK